jgi:hypothetical protein
LIGDVEDNALYFEYAIRFMRVYLSMTCIAGIHTCCSIYIEKAAKVAILPFSRQILFLNPLLLLLLYFFGIDSVMFAQSITDLLLVLLIVVFLTDELKKMSKEDLA